MVGRFLLWSNSFKTSTDYNLIQIFNEIGEGMGKGFGGRQAYKRERPILILFYNF